MQWLLPSLVGKTEGLAKLPPYRGMAQDDLNEQLFSEKQLYRGDVVGEDDEGACSTHVVGIGVADGELPGAAARFGLRDALERRRSGAGRSSSAAAAASAQAAAREDTSAPGTSDTKLVNVGRAGRRKKPCARAAYVVYWLETKYDILPEVAGSFEGWKEATSPMQDFDLLWCDTAIPAERFMKLKSYQKMNHFVGMSSITRKNNLGRNLLRMRKQFPTEYRFFPDTWILPTDLSDFKLQFTPAKNKTFIIKPDNGCQGKGIFLIREAEKIPVDFSTTYVAQRYIHRPFLLDGHKFDLRLYVLVMGCEPLRIFLHRRGLVRLAADQYVEPTVKNLPFTTVHLTNYAINKFSPNFEENTNPDDAQDGHKRSWEAVYKFLKEQGHDVEKLMREIEDLIIKTLIAVQPSLSHFYHSCQPDDVENSMCFEILGFDVILDHKLQPWLLEVNHAPSFTADSELDRIVKNDVLHDTFTLISLSPETRRRHKREAREKMEQRAMGVAKKQSLEERMAEEDAIAIQRTAWEDAHLNGYTRLYPSEQKEKEYAQIHDAAVSIWEMLMGGNARRTIRLSQRGPPEAEGKADGGKSDGKSGKDSGADAPERKKRSADEIREAVERLTSGCSAKPREMCKTRSTASKAEPKHPPVVQSADSGGSASSSNAPERNDAEGATAPAAEKAATADAGAAAAVTDEPKPARSNHGRPEVFVGDIIKVQTNLGWESVVVKAKRGHGKLDIQFRDGELMRSVLPRILQEPKVKHAPSSNSADPGEGSPAMSSGSPHHEPASGLYAPGTSSEPPASSGGAGSGAATTPDTSDRPHGKGLRPPGWPFRVPPLTAAARGAQSTGSSSTADVSTGASTGAQGSGGSGGGGYVPLPPAAVAPPASSLFGPSTPEEPPAGGAAEAAEESGTSGNSLATLITTLDKHLSAQLRNQATGRRGSGAGVSSASPTPLLSSTGLLGPVAGSSGDRSTAGLVDEVLGAKAPETRPTPPVSQPQEHLQQLISVRPIGTRRKR